MLWLCHVSFFYFNKLTLDFYGEGILLTNVIWLHHDIGITVKMIRIMQLHTILFNKIILI